MKPTLSPKELASVLGVSESSVKRWVDEGRIDAGRTQGGHRRIAVEEAVRFLRDARLPVVRPDLLGLRGLGPDHMLPAAAGEEGPRLLAFLTSGRDVEARGLLLSLYFAGWSPAQILDGPVAWAMEEIGELWTRDQAGIYLEHRGTDICIRGFQELRLLLPEPGAGLVAVGGSPGGDPYILPGLGASLVLAHAGFAVTHLGPDTPLDTLRTAAGTLGARLLYLSVTSRPDPVAWGREGGRLLDALLEQGTTLVVGGRESRRLGGASHPRLLLASSMAELEAFARGLLEAGDPRR